MAEALRSSGAFARGLLPGGHRGAARAPPPAAGAAAGAVRAARRGDHAGAALVERVRHGGERGRSTRCRAPPPRPWRCTRPTGWSCRGCWTCTATPSSTSSPRGSRRSATPTGTAGAHRTPTTPSCATRRTSCSPSCRRARRAGMPRCGPSSAASRGSREPAAPAPPKAEPLVRNLDLWAFGAHRARAMIDLPSASLARPAPAARRSWPTSRPATSRPSTCTCPRACAATSAAPRSSAASSTSSAATPATNIIHGSALSADDLRDVAAAGCRLVWSPQSNLRLYGETTLAAEALAARYAGRTRRRLAALRARRACWRS